MLPKINSLQYLWQVHPLSLSTGHRGYSPIFYFLKLTISSIESNIIWFNGIPIFNARYLPSCNECVCTIIAPSYEIGGWWRSYPRMGPTHLGYFLPHKSHSNVFHFTFESKCKSKLWKNWRNPLKPTKFVVSWEPLRIEVKHKKWYISQI